MTENSASLTGCNRLTCKGDGKLFLHEDRVNTTSSGDEDWIFRNQRNFPTVNLTSFDKYDWIFQYRRNFPTIFELTRRSFPTIFRQGCNLLLYHCATLPLYTYLVIFYLKFCFVITLIIFVSTVSSICQQCVYLCQYSVHLRQYCVFLCQYCVKLRHYCVFLSQYSVQLRQYCVFLRQYCVNLRQYCVNLRQCCDFLREVIFMEGPLELNMGPSLADVLLCTFASTNAGFSSFSVRKLLSWE